jgi:hypothetical protein
MSDPLQEGFDQLQALIALHDAQSELREVRAQLYDTDIELGIERQVTTNLTHTLRSMLEVLEGVLPWVRFDLRSLWQREIDLAKKTLETLDKL